MKEVLSISAAFLASLALTPVVMRIAHRTGMVAQPKKDRWHKKPVALLGGVGIFGAFLAGSLPFMEIPNDSIRVRVVGVMVGAGLMFAVGLIDDLVQIKPAAKLIAQIVAACVLVSTGIYFDILQMPLVTIPLTIFFVVGIANAFNLLDNMDGLASGVAAICVLTIFVFNQALGKPQALGILCLALAGALLGFLVFNFNPASIFMGDSGSLFVGFTVAAVSIMGTWEQASNTFLILAVPVLLLGLPIFDTTFVTITRRLAGKPVSQGGKDHTSHRLVRLGLSERRAVLTMYAVCASFSLIAVMSLQVGGFAIGIISILALVVVLLFGVFLAQDKIYRTVEETNGERATHLSQRRGTLIGTLVLHKLRMAEVLMDLLLFAAAYISAYLIRFEGQINAHNQAVIIYSLPIVLAVKFLCFYGFGLYRRLWEFTGIHDLIVIGKAVVSSSVVSVFVLWGLTRLEGYSRAVFIVDCILLLVFAAGSRVMFRVFREALTVKNGDGRRILIYGAGSAGEMLLRELRNDPSLDYRPIGFLDDDVRKQGKLIHGLRIHGGREILREVVSGSTVDEIVIAIPSLNQEARQELFAFCRQTGVECRSVQPIVRRILN